MILKQVLFITFCLGLFACNSTFPKQSSVTVTKRIVELSKIVKKQPALPSQIKNSHCIEEQIGDDLLGPSDYFTFCVISVAVSDIPTWRKRFSPLQAPNRPAHYTAPRNKVDWWPSEAEFKTFEYFEPSLITGGANGWAGISPQVGKIYIFSFTT